MSTEVKILLWVDLLAGFAGIGLLYLIYGRDAAWFGAKEMPVICGVYAAWLLLLEYLINGAPRKRRD